MEVNQVKSTLSFSSPILAGMIALASFVVYFNTLFNGFVFDDQYQVLANPWIRDFSYIPTIFTTEVWGFKANSVTNYYRPLLHIFYMITYHVFGLKAWGFHLVNVMLHAGVSILVFLAGAELLKKYDLREGPYHRYPPFIAAMVFAVHPIHTEAVAWVAGIPDLSYSFFSLLSFYFYIKASDGVLPSHNVYRALSVVWFFSATLCKETALTLPAAFIIYDYAFNRTKMTFPELLKRYLPYLAIIAVYFAMRIYALGTLVRIDRHGALSTYECLINIFPLFIKYIGKLLLPVNLTAIHEFHPGKSFLETGVFLSFIATLALFFAVYKATRKTKLAIFGLCLIIIPLVPSFYIRAIPYPFAERYLYLPSFGFVLLLAMLLHNLPQKWDKIILPLVVVVIASFSVMTFQRNIVWRNEFNLWSDTVKKSPNDAVIRYNYAAVLATKGQIDDSIEQYQRAISLYPTPAGYNDLGMNYDAKGWHELAMDQYRTAIKLDPKFADAHFNLGLSYKSQGQPDTALSHFRTVARMKPADADTHYQIGLCLLMKKMDRDALEAFAMASKLAPDNKRYRDASDGLTVTQGR